MTSFVATATKKNVHGNFKHLNLPDRLLTSSFLIYIIFAMFSRGVNDTFISFLYPGSYGMCFFPAFATNTQSPQGVNASFK